MSLLAWVEIIVNISEKQWNVPGSAVVIACRPPGCLSDHGVTGSRLQLRLRSTRVRVKVTVRIMICFSCSHMTDEPFGYKSFLHTVTSVLLLVMKYGCVGR